MGQCHKSWENVVDEIWDNVDEIWDNVDQIWDNVDQIWDNFVYESWDNVVDQIWDNFVYEIWDNVHDTQENVETGLSSLCRTLVI